MSEKANIEQQINVSTKNLFVSLLCAFASLRDTKKDLTSLLESAVLNRKKTASYRQL